MSDDNVVTPLRRAETALSGANVPEATERTSGPDSSASGTESAPRNKGGRKPGTTAQGEERCRATSRATGEQCRQYAMTGLTVCHFHGGAQKTAKAKSARAKLEKRANREIRTQLKQGDVRKQAVRDPLESLARLAGEIQVMKDVLADRVERAESRANGRSDRYIAELAAYERALDRSVRVLDVLARSGFEERRTKITEQQGAVFAGAQRVILGRMLDAVVDLLRDRGITEPDLVRALERHWGDQVSVVVPEELRAIARRAESDR